MTQWGIYKFTAALRLKARLQDRAFRSRPDETNERYFEYAWMLRHLKLFPGQRVLDVGSSSSLTPCLIAKHLRAVVYAIDSHDSVVIQDTYASVLDVERAGGKVIVGIHDTTTLPYADGFFDAITCISTIEHIPGDGDTLALNELNRVLRPGGLLVLTVPYATTFETVYVEKDVYGRRYTGTPVFFERHYSQEVVKTRLLSHPSLTLVTSAFAIEWRRLPWYLKVVRECLPDPGLRSLFEAKTKWRETQDITHLTPCHNPSHSHAVFLCLLRKEP